MLEFPVTKGRVLLRVLTRPPLNYDVVRQKGSHRSLRVTGRAPLTFHYAEADDVPGGLVRKFLVEQAGLDEQEALDLVRGKKKG